MTTFIEKHFKGLIILLLLILCLLLFIRRNNGRYMLCPDSHFRGVIYVLDTKTSKLWVRSADAQYYSLCFGTNNKPIAGTVIDKKFADKYLKKQE